MEELRPQFPFQTCSNSSSELTTLARSYPAEEPCVIRTRPPANLLQRDIVHGVADRSILTLSVIISAPCTDSSTSPCASHIRLLSQTGSSPSFRCTLSGITPSDCIVKNSALAAFINCFSHLRRLRFEGLTFSYSKVQTSPFSQTPLERLYVDSASRELLEALFEAGLPYEVFLEPSWIKTDTRRTLALVNTYGTGANRLRLPLFPSGVYNLPYS